MDNLKEKKEIPAIIDDENKRVRKSLKDSIKDGAFFSIMDSIIGNFLSAYALFLGAPNMIISLLSSLPDLFGSFFQLLTIKVRDYSKRLKPAIVIASFFQGLIILLLLTLPMFEANLKFIFLLVIAICFTMLGNFISPLWKSLMGDLVPEDERGAYFSRRTLITGTISFLATFIAGFILNHFKKVDSTFTGFAILFVIAFVSRAVSSFWLSKLYERENKIESDEGKNTINQGNKFFDFVKNLNKTDFGRFVIFVSLFSLSVAIASPFFVVYKLKELNLSYVQFTLLSLAELIANLTFLRAWGYLNDKKGSKFVISIAGSLIPFVPFLWLLSKNFYYLMALQIFSGAIWGGFNLAIGNFLFDSTEQKTRTRYIAYFNLFNGFSVFIGALFGGLLLQYFNSVRTLFLISSIFRLLIVILFLRKLKEMRLIEMPLGKSFIHYNIYIKPKRVGFHNDMYYPVDRLSKIKKENKPKKIIPKERLVNDAHNIHETTDHEKKKIEKKFIDEMLKKMNNKK